MTQIAVIEKCSECVTSLEQGGDVIDRLCAFPGCNHLRAKGSVVPSSYCKEHRNNRFSYRTSEPRPTTTGGISTGMSNLLPLYKRLLNTIFGNKCYLCGSLIENIHIGRECHIDHVVPVSRGGDNRLCNLRLTHAFCNLSKGNKGFTGTGEAHRAT